MKLLKQKTSGEIYVWTEVLAKRSDMEEYVRPPTIVIPEQSPKTQEEVDEKETSVGEAQPKQEEPEAKPKSKSPSKGKR